MFVLETGSENKLTLSDNLWISHIFSWHYFPKQTLQMMSLELFVKLQRTHRVKYVLHVTGVILLSNTHPVNQKARGCYKKCNCSCAIPDSHATFVF